MKNIDYLKQFFKKHQLSGRIKVRYDKPGDDDYMTDITFENGDVININDIIFDIESDLPEDLMKHWLKDKKESGIRLVGWVGSDNHYMPDIDNSSVKEYQDEMNVIIENVKETIDKLFTLEDDSDEDEDD